MKNEMEIRKVKGHSGEKTFYIKKLRNGKCRVVGGLRSDCTPTFWLFPDKQSAEEWIRSFDPEYKKPIKVYPLREDWQSGF